MLPKLIVLLLQIASFYNYSPKKSKFADGWEGLVLGDGKLGLAADVL